MIAGGAIAGAEGGAQVESNYAKQEVLGGARADLSALPSTLRGAPSAPPDESKGYAGGLLPAVRVLGAYLGDAEVAAQLLVARVRKKLRPLEMVCRLRDTRGCSVSMQVQMELLRFCANSSLVYFLRTMGPAVTRRAARVHDALIEEAFHRIVGTGQATRGERRRAAEQARLPVGLGGCGLTAQASIAGAACVGSWSLVWRPMQQLLPQLFAGVDIATEHAPCFRELRRAHAELLAVHKRVAGVYRTWDALGEYYDYDKEGEGHRRYHPACLPRRHQLLPVAAMGSENEYNQHAQRRYSRIVHNAAWLKLQAELQRVSRREGARFMAVSQPFAGAFLNAVPKHAAFRMPTCFMRIAVQRRLGLPLMAAAAAAARRTEGGVQHDVLGDAAQALSSSGHGHRHCETLRAIYDALRRVWGAAVTAEPQSYRDYSDHRPDLTIMELALRVFDLKIFDPVGSDPSAVGMRGAYVAFGNTRPAAREAVLGLRERGVAGGAAFNPRTGAGYVAAKGGDYARAQRAGVAVAPLLIETFGGFGDDLRRLLEEAAEVRANRLSHDEYDETTWSARTWTTFVAQRISVAVHRATALEIMQSLRMGPVEGRDLY